MNLMIKNYDFDRVVLFVDLVWLKSIDFTGVLSDWWDVNRWFLMCYFIIIYGIFGRVRLKPYFIRAERYFEAIFNDFWRYRKWWKRWFFNVLSNSVSNSKWGFRRENIRYVLSGNRIFVLKCKPRPPCLALKHTIIVQYYGMFWHDIL